MREVKTERQAEVLQIRPERVEEGLTFSEDLVKKYLEDLRRRGRAEDTIKSYSRKLEWFCQLLPEDRRIRRGSLEDIRRRLLEEGYAPATVNAFTAVVNGFLDSCEHRELQVSQPLALRQDEAARRGLSREEYLRLLGAARRLGRERLYLLIKMFASTGLMISQLPDMTVEAAQKGRIHLSAAEVYIPRPLCRELLDYAGRQGIRTGAIFITKSGKEIDRSNLTREIQSLAREARVSPEKCSPRCLRKLYQETQAGFRAEAERMVEAAEDRLQEREQAAIGW
ncbi:MAG: site-specific integrase [Lachnospiraceae bacterium]|nr:site-specific integrase [Lachnospiraceae bacterium]